MILCESRHWSGTIKGHYTYSRAMRLMNDHVEGFTWMIPPQEGTSALPLAGLYFENRHRLDRLLASCYVRKMVLHTVMHAEMHADDVLGSTTSLAARTQDALVPPPSINGSWLSYTGSCKLPVNVTIVEGMSSLFLSLLKVPVSLLHFQKTYFSKSRHLLNC